MKILFMTFAIVFSSSIFAEKKVVKTKTKKEATKKLDSSNVERLLYGYKIVEMTKDTVIVDLSEDFNFRCDKARNKKYRKFKNSPLTKEKPIKAAYLTYLESTKVERLTFDKYITISDPLRSSAKSKKKYAQFKRLDSSLKNKRAFKLTPNSPNKKDEPLAVFPYKVKALKVYSIGSGEDVKATDYKYFSKFKATPEFYNNCIKKFGNARQKFKINVGNWKWNHDSQRYSGKKKKYIYSKTKGYYLIRKKVRKSNKRTFITNLWNSKNLLRHVSDEVTVLRSRNSRKSPRRGHEEIIYINNEFVHIGNLVNKRDWGLKSEIIHQTHSITQKLNVNGRDVYVIKEVPNVDDEFTGYNYLFLYKNDVGEWRKTSLPDYYFTDSYFAGDLDQAK